MAGQNRVFALDDPAIHAVHFLGSKNVDARDVQREDSARPGMMIRYGVGAAECLSPSS
jgi:hypothetical protein